MHQKNNLPPLAALQAFEAAARLGSFTAAAGALDSTQPAISQHVHRLEADLGVPLFERQPRGVRLTRSGQQLYEAVADGLSRLTQGYTEARQHSGSAVINLVTDFAIATYWILPRLRRFRDAHPDVDVRIITSQQPLLPDQAEADIAILFARGSTLQAPARQLFSEAVTPVVSPLLLDRLQLPARLEALTELPLLQLEADYHSGWFDWPALFPRLGLGRVPREAELIFNNYTLLLQAALSGQGVAIGWSPFIEPMLASGGLVALTDNLLGGDDDLGYYLAFSSHQRLAPQVLTLADWLQAESRSKRGPS